MAKELLQIMKDLLNVKKYTKNEKKIVHSMDWQNFKNNVFFIMKMKIFEL